MKRLLLVIFVLLTLPTISQAQELTQSEIYGQPNPAKLTVPKVKARKEALYFSDEILRDYDPNIGIIKDSFFTMRDKNRFSFGYNFSADYSDFTELTNFEIEFIQNLRDWKNTWWGVIFKSGSGNFDAISENQPYDSTAPADAEASAANQRPNGASQNYTQLGIGMGNRFRFLLDFVET
ncbi:hypothetical protein N9B72_01540, partial [Bacteriovoracaceae bacterium]|nr:hypothetical protein [Bacteriovoracaceae bacterium]